MKRLAWLTFVLLNSSFQLWAGSLVDPDIVHIQVRREDCVETYRAGQLAAHGQVENDEERVVKYPFPVAHIGGGHREIAFSIIVPLDLAGLPLDGIGVEIIGNSRTLAGSICSDPKRRNSPARAVCP